MLSQNGSPYSVLGNLRKGSNYNNDVEVLEQANDRAWLAKMANALNQHWQKKNAAKKHSRRSKPGPKQSTMNPSPTQHPIGFQ